MAERECIDPVYRQEDEPQACPIAQDNGPDQDGENRSNFADVSTAQCPAISSGTPPRVGGRVAMSSLQSTAVPYFVRFRLLNCTEIHKANSKGK